MKLLGHDRQRRVEKARAIVIRYIDEVVAEAELVKEKLYTGPYMKRSDAYHLSHVSFGLSTTQLKWLLRTNDQGVADWANDLPEVRNILHTNGLMFVYTHTYRRPHHTTLYPQHLTIVREGSTHNSMTWPGK